MDSNIGQVNVIKPEMFALLFWRMSCRQLVRSMLSSPLPVRRFCVHVFCVLSIRKPNGWSCPGLPGKTLGGGFHRLQCRPCLWGVFQTFALQKVKNQSIPHCSAMRWRTVKCSVLCLDNAGAAKRDLLEPSCPSHPPYHSLFLYWPWWALPFLSWLDYTTFLWALCSKEIIKYIKCQ